MSSCLPCFSLLSHEEYEQALLRTKRALRRDYCQLQIARRHSYWWRFPSSRTCATLWP